MTPMKLVAKKKSQRLPDFADNFAMKCNTLQPYCDNNVTWQGAEVGAHILSGNVFEPRALQVRRVLFFF